MPVYNGIEYIDESIKSVISQTFKDWELLIGVNGHSKNSSVYKKALKCGEQDAERITVIDMFDCKGKSNALNKMIKVARYEWVALLDVDDAWLPKKLESQIPYTNDYDIIGTHCKYFGDSNVIPSIPLGNISNYNFLQVNPIINSSCLVKKNLCYWNSKHDGVEDYDMWIRLWKENKKFYNVHGIHVLHRIHKDSAFNAQGNNNKVGDVIKKYT
tara:strand:- start:26 stop:667 length:642 start_codon:yes stop_codon:yes gene_type:complete